MDAEYTINVQFLAREILLWQKEEKKEIHSEYKQKETDKTTTKKPTQLLLFRITVWRVEKMQCEILYNVDSTSMYYLGQGCKTVPDSGLFSSMGKFIWPFWYSLLPFLNTWYCEWSLLLWPLCPHCLWIFKLSRHLLQIPVGHNWLVHWFPLLGKLSLYSYTVF